jgi:SAM-dependent methyltransferase
MCSKNFNGAEGKKILHKESFELMKYFVKNYLDENHQLKILDVGSYDINGSYKSIFQNPNWNYSGLDMTEGPNVDIVSKSGYDFGIDEQFDVVVSGNCLEHVEAPWKWIKEVERVTKKGGMVCIITPFSIGEHKCPIDCWRILPDGYRYLLEQESNFTILETRLNQPFEIRYRFFQHRPKLKWVIKLLPRKLIKKRFEYKHYLTQDTYVIAQK